jgi:hypothetical protein
VPESWALAERVGVSVLYVVLGLTIFYRERDLIRPLLRDGFRTPYRELALEEAPGGAAEG